MRGVRMKALTPPICIDLIASLSFSSSLFPERPAAICLIAFSILNEKLMKIANGNFGDFFRKFHVKNLRIEVELSC
jgi:hypothetical protein